MGRFTSTPTRTPRCSRARYTSLIRKYRGGSNVKQCPSPCSLAANCLTPALTREATRRKTRSRDPRDVTPWEPTTSFHGFFVKVIRYYETAGAVNPRRQLERTYARNLFATQAEIVGLIDRGHLFGTIALSRVCLSLARSIT